MVIHALLCSGSIFLARATSSAFLANPRRKPNSACVAALEPPYFILDEADW